MIDQLDRLEPLVLINIHTVPRSTVQEHFNRAKVKPRAHRRSTNPTRRTDELNPSFFLLFFETSSLTKRVQNSLTRKVVSRAFEYLQLLAPLEPGAAAGTVEEVGEVIQSSHFSRLLLLECGRAGLLLTAQILLLETTRNR